MFKCLLLCNFIMQLCAWWKEGRMFACMHDADMQIRRLLARDSSPSEIHDIRWVVCVGTERKHLEMTRVCEQRATYVKATNFKWIRANTFNANESANVYIFEVWMALKARWTCPSPWIRLVNEKRISAQNTNQIKSTINDWPSASEFAIQRAEWNFKETNKRSAVKWFQIISELEAYAREVLMK